MGSEGKEGALKKVHKKNRGVKKNKGSGFEVASDSNVAFDKTPDASVKSNKKEKKKKKMTVENEVGDTNVYVEKHSNNEEAKSQKKMKRKLELNKDGEGIRKKDKRTKVGKDLSNDDGGSSKVKEASNEMMCEGGEGNETRQIDVGMDVRNNDELKASKKRKKKQESRNKDGIDNVSSFEQLYENDKVKISKKEEIAKTGNSKEDVTKKKKVKKGKRDGEVEVLGGNDISGNRKTMKKPKSVKDSSERVPRVDISEEDADCFDKSKKRKSKRVSFIDNVEVFGENIEEDGYVRGRRFTKEEDQMVMEAVSDYIDEHGLGEEGLNMVLYSRSHSEVRHCWKDIAAALPWRPPESIYYRAHILFERDESRIWTAEDFEMIKKHYEKNGADWKQLAGELGKHRFHVKDAWRRIKLPNMKKGRWSQEEYQTLFDLVNKDLRMKAFGLKEKKSKHGMLRDNICWGAISDELSTRSNAICCVKWYDQLTSPMVSDGIWNDADDYRLLGALYSLDACCFEDVEWDDLLDHRPGVVCRKRWNQMVRHIGEHGNKSFAEQVEVLSQRYCPELLEARETYDNKPIVP